LITKKLWWYVANAEYPRSNATLIFTYIFGICFVLAFSDLPASACTAWETQGSWNRLRKKVEKYNL
jgi:hypothetical protein